MPTVYPCVPEHEIVAHHQGRQRGQEVQRRRPFERLLRSDVKYRFVIDMASLQ